MAVQSRTYARVLDGSAVQLGGEKGIGGLLYVLCCIQSHLHHVQTAQYCFLLYGVSIIESRQHDVVRLPRDTSAENTVPKRGPALEGLRLFHMGHGGIFRI